MSDYNWVTKYGNFEIIKNEIRFIGEINKQNNIDFPSMGLAISNSGLASGEMRAKIKFSSNTINDNTCCLVPFYDNENNYFIVIGFAISSVPGPAFTLSIYNESEIQNRWKTLKIDGNSTNIKPNVFYDVKTVIKGSKIELFINDVGVFTHNMDIYYPKKQAGLFCRSGNEIIIRDFKVLGERPKAFTVMQFTSPYNELFSDVIEPVCNEKKIEINRIDKVFGPGLILNDIINEIQTSSFIIAEITPMNTNVFFEIGYALALNKPIILIAEKSQEKEIPFDVRGFRILFYENTIPGKNKIIENLKNHIDAVLQQ